MKTDKTRAGSASGETLVRLEDFRDVYAESIRNALDHQDGWVASPGFNAAQVGLVNIRTVSDFLLRKIPLPSDPLNVSRHASLDGHARTGARSSGPRP